MAAGVVASVNDGVDEEPGSGERARFEVRLDNFEGPFDVLLGLIAKHKLDVTEVALSVVTDEFISFIRAHGPEWDLDEASDFLVVAATLLDLKAARLLPSGEVEDEDDLALLEARDLLFARLLQYRAFKQIASEMGSRMAEEARRFPRAVGLEDRYADLLPEVVVGLGPTQLAELAAKALEPKRAPEVPTQHLRDTRVSVREEAVIVIDRLRRAGSATFRSLSADCSSTLQVVGRFLALLELYRERVVSFEQLAPLSELTVRWTGDAETDVAVSDEFDVEPSAQPGDAQRDSKEQE